MTAGVASTINFRLQEQDARTSHLFQRGVMAVAYQDLGVQKFKVWKMSQGH